MLCWMWHGQPDFYYRGGWDGVDLHFVFAILGGGVIGIYYGVALLIFERRSRRRVRVLLASAGTVLFAFVVAALIVEHEFQQHRIGFVLMPQLIAVIFGALISTATARRTP
ncbi:MAG: hypothetical protein K8S99_01155 [Planctomycetes bacterium]|nr:hypothetical protein [Planctomycetota bacterium]